MGRTTTTSSSATRSLGSPWLSYQAVKPLLTWHGAVDALREGHALLPPSQGDVLLGPDGGMILARVAHMAGLGYGVKAETVVPSNAARNLPSVQGAVLLFDPDTGSVHAVIESAIVTEFKTAADSILGAQLLALPDAEELLIVGAGTVARSLVYAYSAIFSGLKRINVWARNHAKAQAFVDSIHGVTATVTAVDDLKAAVQGAHIMSSATMSKTPLILGEWVQAGTHVDLIGAFTPEMRESDDALMAKARVFVDCKETTIDRIGDLTGPIASGAITRDDVKGDLFDMLANTSLCHRRPSDVTVFKNGGGAHLDLMIANYIARAAEAARAL